MSTIKKKKKSITVLVLTLGEYVQSPPCCHRALFSKPVYFYECNHNSTEGVFYCVRAAVWVKSRSDSTVNHQACYKCTKQNVINRVLFLHRNVLFFLLLLNTCVLNKHDKLNTLKGLHRSATINTKRDNFKKEIILPHNTSQSI